MRLWLKFTLNGQLNVHSQWISWSAYKRNEEYSLDNIILDCETATYRVRLFLFKQEFGFTKRVDQGWITIVKGL